MFVFNCWICFSVVLKKKCWGFSVEFRRRSSGRSSWAFKFLIAEQRFECVRDIIWEFSFDSKRNLRPTGLLSRGCLTAVLSKKCKTSWISHCGIVGRFYWGDPTGSFSERWIDWPETQLVIIMMLTRMDRLAGWLSHPRNSLGEFRCEKDEINLQNRLRSKSTDVMKYFRLVILKVLIPITTPLIHASMIPD